jgi:hypothetical protein
MTRDDVGDFFDTGTVDEFQMYVDTLMATYEKILQATDELDVKNRPSPDLEKNPELQMEIECWDRQISAIKHNVSKMAFESLLILFDEWLQRNGNFHESAKLSKARFEQMRTARNSIVHHRCKPEYSWKRKMYKVNEEFLYFDETFGEERVSIERQVLKKVACELKAYVSDRRMQNQTSFNK